MSKFGELLRYYRQQCKDPLHGGPLTQERLGELIGQEIGDVGYTGAAISEWERNKSHINKEHRTVLTALIKVLYTGGGIKTLTDANTFLLLGNYRPLNEAEQQFVCPEWVTDHVVEEQVLIEKNLIVRKDAPPFPSISSASSIPTLASPSLSTAPPKAPSLIVVTSYLPNKPYSRFVGRTDLVEVIVQTLSDPKGVTIIGIDGLGGIGKTALARELVEQVGKERVFHFTYWTTAKRVSFEPNDDTIKAGMSITYHSILSGIINWLGMGDELHSVQQLSQKEHRIREIFYASPCLIVLDNLETADEDQDEITVKLGNLLRPSKAILTSRERWDVKLGLYEVHLSGLSVDESITLMQAVAQERHIERVLSATKAQLVPLVEVVGGAPLALKLATGLLATQDVIVLENELRSITWQPISDLYRYLFLRSWQQLDEAGQQLLFAMAQFSEDIGANAIDLKNTSGLSISVFAEAIQVLTRLSLVEILGGIQTTRYALHPLTLNFVRSDLLNQSR